MSELENRIAARLKPVKKVDPQIVADELISTFNELAESIRHGDRASSRSHLQTLAEILGIEAQIDSLDFL